MTLRSLCALSVACLALAACHQRQADNPLSASPAAEPAPLSETVVPHDVPHFLAMGVEPFWSIRIEGDRLWWSSPEQPEELPLEVIASHADGRWQWQGQLASKPATLELWQEDCSDGMSDGIYSHTVRWTVDGTTRHGCARQRSGR